MSPCEENRLRLVQGTNRRVSLRILIQQIDSISFRNFYTASITVKVRTMEEKSQDEGKARKRGGEGTLSSRHVACNDVEDRNCRLMRMLTLDP